MPIIIIIFYALFYARIDEFEGCSQQLCCTFCPNIYKWMIWQICIIRLVRFLNSYVYICACGQTAVAVQGTVANCGVDQSSVHWSKQFWHKNTASEQTLFDLFSFARVFLAFKCCGITLCAIVPARISLEWGKHHPRSFTSRVYFSLPKQHHNSRTFSISQA